MKPAKPARPAKLAKPRPADPIRPSRRPERALRGAPVPQPPVFAVHQTDLPARRDAGQGPHEPFPGRPHVDRKPDRR